MTKVVIDTFISYILHELLLLQKVLLTVCLSTRPEQPVSFNLVNHKQSAIYDKHIPFNCKETRSLNNYIALLDCGDNYILAP